MQLVESEFALPRRSGKHKSPEVEHDLHALTEKLSECEVHKFKPGRISKMSDVVDVFERGIEDVFKSKLQAFQTRIATNSSSAEEMEGSETILVPPSAFDNDPAADSNTGAGTSGADHMLDEFADCDPYDTSADTDEDIQLMF